MKKIEFKNLPDKTTPINSTNLNKIQDNIEEVFEGNESMGSIVVEDITCKNMFDKNNLNQYYWINTDTGIPYKTTNIGNSTTKYIKVEPNTKYTISGFISGQYFALASYNSSKAFNRFIANSQDSYGKDYSFTTSNDDKYIILAINNSQNNTNLQIEKGTVATNQVEHKKFGYNSMDSMGEIVVDDITCKNILDFDSITKANKNVSSTPTVGKTLSFYNSTKSLQFYIPVSHLRGNEVIYSNSLDYANDVRIFEVDSNYCFVSYFSSSMKNGNFKSGVIDNTTSYLCVILTEETDISLTADIKPQLEKGSTATEYTPFKKFGYNAQESMGNIVVDDITCKNILPNNIQSQTINGVTVTRNNDGSVTFNGTTTAYTKLEIVSNLELDSGTYIFYFSEKGTVSGNFFGAIRDENSGVVGKDLQIHNSITINKFSLAEAKRVTITVALGTSTTVTNFKIYPMLEKGSTATGYVEHKEYENKEVYSTNEQVIGTWIDGKPLYRKVIKSTIPTTSADGTLADSYVTIASNIETVFVEYGFIPLSGGVTNILPFTNSNNYRTTVSISNSKTLRIMNWIASNSGEQIIVSVMYTKTTDNT